MTTPFYKLTLQEAIAWHKAGKLTIKGLIYASIVTQRKTGSKLTVNSVKEYCKLLGIQERNFYKAKADLIKEDEICIEIKGRVMMWLNTDSEVVTVGETVTDQSISEVDEPTDQSISETDQSISDSLINRSVQTDQSISASIYTDLNRSNSLDLCVDRTTHTEAAAVPVEVLDPEVSQCDRQDVSNLKQLPPSELQEVNHSFGQKNTDPGEDQSSEAARDNKYNGVSVAKLEELQEKFDDGLITDLPDLEKKALAAYLMGDIIKLYRKSGKLLASSTNDLNPGFVRFYAWSEYQDETALSKARATILKLERTISSWSVLASVVSEWKACESNQELLQEKAKRRASSKRGTDSELDKTVATSSTAERFRKIQEQQEREAAIKAAKEAERVKASEVRSEPVTGAASPQPDSKPFEAGKGDPIPPHVKAEADRIAERVRQQQQERRRA